MHRQTSDLVALILAGTVAVVIVLTAVASLYIAINYPTDRVLVALDAIGKIIGVVIGALIGYMAGKRSNGNGH